MLGEVLSVSFVKYILLNYIIKHAFLGFSVKYFGKPNQHCIFTSVQLQDILQQLG